LALLAAAAANQILILIFLSDAAYSLSTVTSAVVRTFFFLPFFTYCTKTKDSIQSFVCVRTANTLIQLIICFFFRSICRRIFLSQSGSPLPKRILLLLDHHLHPLLHVGHRFVGVVLVGRQRSARPRLTRSHNSSHNGNADDWY
jgi:hypothetical protein